MTGCRTHQGRLTFGITLEDKSSGGNHRQQVLHHAGMLRANTSLQREDIQCECEWDYAAR